MDHYRLLIMYDENKTNRIRELSKNYLLSSYLFDLYELFFPLNESTKKMQTYAKVKAAEIAKGKAAPVQPQIPQQNFAQPAPQEHSPEIPDATDVPKIEFTTNTKINDVTPVKVNVQAQNPVQQVPQPMQIVTDANKEKMTEEYIQSAISSLDFSDAKTAIQYIHAALDLLN